ncbi:MAG: ATP-binding protein, partial [Defluviitaleaceae bacterium]|nr:ATP-binding protein [Defluviitaleaceae bacterium]
EREQLLYENGYDDSFFTDVYKCVACEDTGFVGGGHCTCLKQRLISCYFDMSNLGKVFKEENFDAFNMSYYSEQIEPNIGISPKDNIKRIWKAALEFVENFGENGDNWLLYGLSGRGKTFLSNCIAGDLLQKGHTVLYTTAPELFRRVEEERFGKGDAKRKGVTGINFAYEADLLIIDDLGTEFATVVTDSELFNFINARMLAQKSTIINTNLTPTDIDANYSNRISSRIHGNYILFHVFGDDIRKAKKYGVSV